MRMMRDVYLK